jgi:ribosomal protein S18 acetylase RimI-like enzyme
MITIHKATTEDAEELLRIKVRAFAWDLEKYGMAPPGYDSLEDLISAINKARYYKILYSDKAVGAFSLYEKGTSHFELGSLYIDPDYHDKGIGSKVVELMEKEYPQIVKWTLDTPYLSFRNHHFYEKMGYVKIDEIKPFENNEFTLFKYEKNKL